MRWMTSPFCRPIFEKMLPGLIEKSLKPLALPFLNDGTMRAWVATSLRLPSARSTSPRSTLYCVSLTFVTPGPPPGGDAAPNPGDMTGVTKISDTQYKVDRSEVDRALNNLAQVATEARIVPSFKNGVANGFKMFSIKPGSIYSKIGLQNGDVIHKINGYEMNSPDKALEIYQKLKDATSVQIELERRGTGMTVNYNIGG